MKQGGKFYTANTQTATLRFNFTLYRVHIASEIFKIFAKDSKLKIIFIVLFESSI